MINLSNSTQDLLEKNFMPMEHFCRILLPSLLSLSSDPVPNVRIPLAKALRRLMDDGKKQT